MQIGTDIARKAHLGNRDQKTAIGDIVAGTDQTKLDQFTHQHTSPFFRIQIDRWWGAFFAAFDGFEIQRLAKFTGRGTNHDQCTVIALDADGGMMTQIGNHPNATDCGGWHDADAIGFVVKRHVARNDREVERNAGLGNALAGTNKLTHDARAFRVTEVHVIRDRKRLGTGGNQVAICFGNGLFATFDRIGHDIARGAICGGCNALVRARNAYDTGITPRTDNRVAHDQMVILFPNPATRREVRGRNQGFQRIDMADLARNACRIDTILLRGRFPRTVVFRRCFGQRIDRKITGNFAMPFKNHAFGIGQDTDDGKVEFPFVKDRLGGVFATGFQDHQHAFLRF